MKDLVVLVLRLGAVAGWGMTCLAQAPNIVTFEKDEDPYGGLEPC